MWSKKQGLAKQGRLVELDLAKAMVIVVMVWLHSLVCAFMGGKAVFAESLSSFIICKILGSLWGAPVFMFAMGVTLTCTKNSTADAYLRRGIRLLLAGLFFNLVRDSLNTIALGAVGLGKVDYILAFKQLCSVDILQLAGVFFLFFGLLKKARCNKKVLLLLAFAGGVVASLFRYSEVKSLATNIFLSYFVGLDCYEYGYFPLFNWSVIIVAGYLWGIYLHRREDKVAAYRKILLFSLPITVAYIVLGVGYDLTFFTDAWCGENHMLWYEQIFCANGALTLVGLFALLAPHLPEKVLGSARFLGKNLTKIYIIHWLLIMWVQYFFLIKYCGLQAGFGGTTALGAVWLALSVGIVRGERGMRNEE